MRHTESIIDLIPYFTSYDQERLTEPVVDGDMVVVTNGYILLVIHEKYLPKNTFAGIDTRKFPDYRKTIAEHDRNNVLFRVDPEWVINECVELPDQEVECADCEGDGLMYSLNKKNNIECLTCQGRGSFAEMPREIRSPDDEDEPRDKSWLFKITHGKQFTYMKCSYVLWVAQLAHRLGKPIEWVRLDERAANIAYIDDILVVMMPLLHKCAQRREGFVFKGNLTIIDVKTTSLSQ